MVQVSNYDAAGRPSRDALAGDLSNLSGSLQQAHRLASEMHLAGIDAGVPETLIHYVENGRNPDIYTREFVELVRRMNQLMRGKMRAFTSFRDVLAGEMESALPELTDDVRRVLECTGGPGSLAATAGSGVATTAATAGGGGGAGAVGDDRLGSGSGGAVMGGQGQGAT